MQFGRTPLYYASERGHVEIAEKLLIRGASYVMFKPEEEVAAAAAEAAGADAAAAAKDAPDGEKPQYDQVIADIDVQPLYAAVSQGHHKILELMFDQKFVKKFDNKHLVFAVRNSVHF